MRPAIITATIAALALVLTACTSSAQPAPLEPPDAGPARTGVHLDGTVPPALNHTSTTR